MPSPRPPGIILFSSSSGWRPLRKVSCEGHPHPPHAKLPKWPPNKACFIPLPPCGHTFFLAGSPDPSSSIHPGHKRSADRERWWAPFRVPSWHPPDTPDTPYTGQVLASTHWTSCVTTTRHILTQQPLSPWKGPAPSRGGPDIPSLLLWLSPSSCPTGCLPRPCRPAS